MRFAFLMQSWTTRRNDHFNGTDRTEPITYGTPDLDTPGSRIRTPQPHTWQRTPTITSVKSPLGSVPAPGLVAAGIISVQLGAGVAKGLFEQAPPSSVVFLRLLFSAAILTVITRRVLLAAMASATRSDLTVMAGFGVALATMNFAIYESMARIPLGIAVTIEFLGPLSVAVALSRRRLDLVWIAMAALGVGLLTRGGTDGADPLGIVLALVAAAGWASYILLSAQTGRRFPGTSGLAMASMVGTLVVAPIGLNAGDTRMWQPDLAIAAVAVALLSSVIPYSLELEALRRMPATVFGVLMSLGPAVAAAVGLVLLDEVLTASEWVAIGCVMTACLGATRNRPPRPEVTP